MTKSQFCAVLLVLSVQSAFADQTYTFCIGELDSSCKVKPRYGCEYNNGAGVRTIAAQLCGGADKFHDKWVESGLRDGNTCGYKEITITCDGEQKNASLSCLKMSAQHVNSTPNGIPKNIDVTVTNNCNSCARVSWNFFQDDVPKEALVDFVTAIQAKSTATLSASPTKFGTYAFRLLNSTVCP